MKNNWWESPEITHQDINDVISFYNDCALVLGCQFDIIKPKKGIPLRKNVWYRDIIRLTRIVHSIDASPKDYIMAQFVMYKKPTKRSREFPTLKMMACPAGVDKWKQYMIKRGTFSPAYSKISHEEMNAFNEKMMKRLMRLYNISKEEDFFRDPILISQLSKSFVEKFQSFKSLSETGYYENTFGVKVQNLFA